MGSHSCKPSYDVSPCILPRPASLSKSSSSLEGVELSANLKILSVKFIIHGKRSYLPHNQIHNAFPM